MAIRSTITQRIKDNCWWYVSMFLRGIVEPSASVEKKQRRSLRLLSVFLLLMTINSLIGTIVVKNSGNNLWVIMLATAAILVVGYGLSRTSYYRLAMILAVSTTVIPILAMILFSPNRADIPNELPWLALPLLVCSLLLSLRYTVIIAIIYTAFVAFLIPFVDIPAANLSQSLAFMFMIFFFVVAIAAVRQQDQSDIEHQLTERKRAEEALRESEERFSKAFSSSPDIISIVNLKDHKFIDVNDSFIRYTGYNYEEVIGHTSDEVRIWAKPEERERILRMLKKKGSVHNEEIHTLTKSGDIRTGLFSAEKINIGGEMCSITVIVDITERKKTEQLQYDENYVLALLGQGAELSEILEAIVLLGEKHDPSIKGSALLFDSTRQWLNPASAPSLPDSFSELMKDGVAVGLNMGSCGTAAYLKERVTVPDIENSPLFQPFEEVIKRAINNGLLACWSQPIISSSGDVLGTIANYSHKLGEPDSENLTVLEWSARIAAIAIERKQAEGALKESEEKFSKAFRSSPDAIAITTLKDGEFIEVNDSYTRINGYTREEVIGHSSAEFGIWSKKEERDKIILILKEQGRVSNEEVLLKTKSGDEKICLFSAEFINIGGEPCMISLATDITGRKRSEEELKQALSSLEQSSAQLTATNKELESFSYSVSHDLRSPLRSIDGFSQALLEDYMDKLDEDGQDYLRRLRGASQKMGELIDGLLKLSRLTRSEMHREKVDLSVLAKEITNRLKETQPERQVDFVIGRGLTVDGDRQLLRVLMENLLGNAWKFTGKRKQARIEFGASQNGDKKAYFVRDNGAGFDMTYADRLFTAFQRLHETDEFPGAGIGLATVQRIINRHGGSVWAEGTEEKGATFYFTLN